MTDNITVQHTCRSCSTMVKITTDAATRARRRRRPLICPVCRSPLLTPIAPQQDPSASPVPPHRTQTY